MRKSLREAVINKFGFKCAYCGCEITLKTMQVDHIVPKISGGNDAIENLFPACRVCNNWKLFHDLEVFRRELSLQVERLNLRSSNYRIAKKYGLVTETGEPIKFYFESII